MINLLERIGGWLVWGEIVEDNYQYSNIRRNHIVDDDLRQSEYSILRETQREIQVLVEQLKLQADTTATGRMVATRLLQRYR